MNSKQSKFAAVLRRAQHFLNEHAGRAGGVNGSEARDELDQALKCIDHFGREQLEQHQRVLDEAQLRQRLGEEIRTRYLRPIVVIANTYVEGARGFELPDPRVSGAVLVHAATCLAERAREHLPTFVANGLSPDFLTRLKAAIAELERSVSAGSFAAICQKGATAGVSSEMQRGRAALRVIDTQLKALWVDDAEMLRAWKACTRPSPVNDAPVEEVGNATALA